MRPIAPRFMACPEAAVAKPANRLYASLNTPKPVAEDVWIVDEPEGMTCSHAATKRVS
jgi:hypothetical protein